MTQRTDQEKQWAKIVARAWADENFKKRLLADPRAVLAEAGVDLEKDMEYSVVEELEKQVVLILPQKPAAGDSVETGEMRRSAWFFK
jgi:hypothetical protein